MARIGIPKNVSKEVRICLQKLAAALDAKKSPDFASFTLNDLTASRLVQSNASKKLTSVTDLTSWIAGTANEIDIADDGDGTLTIGLINPLIVAKGGTGLAALTDHSLLIGSGTGEITLLGVATNGQIPIGSTGADPVLATITGTANQIVVTNAAGSITLSTSQDIHTGASPTFDVLTTNSVTIGSITEGTGSTFTATPYPVIRLIRYTSSTTSGLAAFDLAVRTSGDMAEGFGGGMTFSIRDPQQATIYIAGIYGRRYDQNDRGTLELRTRHDGSWKYGVTLYNGMVRIGNSNTVPNVACDVTGDIEATGFIDSDGGFKDNGTAGIDTTFLDADGNTITVSGGIITAKTAP